MASIDNFEEVRLYKHLKTSGLTAGFTDVYGNAQPAPKIFISEYDDTELGANERALLFRVTGQDQLGDNANGHIQVPVTINVFSKDNKQDSGIARGYAEDINNWLKQNFTSDDECILSIQSFGVSGPFYGGESRREYTINLIVKFYS